MWFHDGILTGKQLEMVPEFGSVQVASGDTQHADYYVIHCQENSESPC